MSNNQNNNQSSEAEEEREQFVEENDRSISEASGDDLDQLEQQDYQQVPELDHYEQEGVDDEEYPDLDRQQRRVVEEQLEERDRQQNQNWQEGFSISSEQEYINHERFEDYDDEDGFQTQEEQKEEEKYLDHEEIRGKLHIWIEEKKTMRWIIKRFKHFLLNFVKPGTQEKIYWTKIQKMQMENKGTIEIDFHHFQLSNNSSLAYWIMSEPQIIFPYLNYTATLASKRINPNYEKIQTLIQVKLTDIPLLESIRDLRQIHLSELIKIIGVVTKTSQVYSQLQQVYFTCKCGAELGPFWYNSSDQQQPLGACGVCQSSNSFMISQQKTKYRNYQTITVQERPQDVPAGRVPRWKEVVLQGDNIDVCKPGDECEVIGVFTQKYDFQLNAKQGFPVFQTVIEANNIKRLADKAEVDMSEEDKKKILEYSKKKNIRNIIKNSIATSIHQRDDIKLGLALAMFGGVPKDINNKHKIRGDINLLMLGDPGVAKSQFLKSVQKSFGRTVYTTGKGASAVGLTASVKKDYQTKEWVLEGGALVLADQGICLIDEFDKMNDHDRTSIHEAMEQQSISISKAGIVTQLKAQCSVICAANPKGGRYNTQLSFQDNVNLTEPILSRFDLLFVVKDEINRENDMNLAGFVINSHIKNHPFTYCGDENEEKQQQYLQKIQSLLLDTYETQEVETMDQDLLKKYIAYARKNFQPKLSQVNQEQLTQFYAELRAESENTGGMSIAVRHFESIIRMAEAHAKMHLRQHVNDYDCNVAISMMLDSFIGSQKFSVSNKIRDKFKKFIILEESANDILHRKLEQCLKQQKLYQDKFQQGTRTQGYRVNLYDFEQAALIAGVQDSIQDYLNSSLFQKYYTIQGSVIQAKDELRLLARSK